jgi:hypothetical protein
VETLFQMDAVANIDIMIRLETMSETNANNIIIRILYNSKGSYSLSLDRLLRFFYKTTRPFEYRPLF